MSSAPLPVGCFFVVSARACLKATCIDVIVPHAIIRGMAAGLLLILLAACDPTAGAAPTPTPASSGTANGSVTLVLWHGWGGAERQALGRLVDRFNEQHPNGRVLLQPMPLATMASDLRAAVAAGSGPHIVIIPNSWVGGLAEAGALRPLDDMIAQPDQDAPLPSTIGGARAPDRDGVTHLYGLPINFDTLALYYNTANILTPPDDTAKLLETARGLSSPNAAPPLWGLALNLSLDNTIGYLYAFGGRVFDDDGKLALGAAGREGAEKWLNWLLKLNNDLQLRARVGSGIAVDREIKYGKVLMTFDWAHQIGTYRSLWGKDLGVSPLPRLSETGQTPRPYIKSDLLAINARAGLAERAAAAEFLHFMISSEAQGELLRSDIQPARRDLKLDGTAPYLVAARAFRDQAEQGIPMPNSSTRGIVDEELRIMLERVLTKQAGATDAVTDADGRIREKLNLSGQ
jgi:arabinogalactan oligomer/maltooligosaccharide transport system substrate-binding protein